MKTIHHIILFFAFWIICESNYAQISQGGEPLPPTPLRHASSALFVEMDSFDAAAMLKDDSLNDILHRATRFAKKFTTDLRPDNSGIRFTTANGTNVWQCGIRSKGAYSINLLFSEYHLPKGAKLFIYNTDRTHKIGAFTEANNNQYNKLPTAPVYGDEIVIEYQEPADAEFKGLLTIGEVNHDYRGLTLRGRPGSLFSTETCHLDAVCFAKYTDIAQAVTLLIINGNEYCTGCMINNTQQDGTPYLLSAAHCFVPKDGATSEQRAQNTVIFFNYQNPTCQTTIIGSEEMSMSSATLVANEKTIDIALLKLTEKPPRYYRPYYAGWNAGTPADYPYIGIHHPMSKTKKIATTEKKLTLVTFDSSNLTYVIEANSHWRVDKWLNGTTEGGSSGSPLFDSNKRLIGGLTGGSSYCSSPYDDYYFAMQKVWNHYPESNRQLKYWLDPKNSGQTQVDGLDPYNGSSCIRMSNKEADEEIGFTKLPNGNSEPMFGQNSLKSSEFAEQFVTAKKNTLYGFNFVTPTWNSNWNSKVKFNVYKGDSRPTQLLTSMVLNLSYTSYSGGMFKNIALPSSASTDNFIKFDSPIQVDSSFYISYEVNYQATDTFAICNVVNRINQTNTSWIKSALASEFVPAVINTSLWIDPIVELGVTLLTPGDTVAPAKIIYDKLTKLLVFKGLKSNTSYQLHMYNASGRLFIAKSIVVNEVVPLQKGYNGIFIIHLSGDDRLLHKKIIIH